MAADRPADEVRELRASARQTIEMAERHESIAAEYSIAVQREANVGAAMREFASGLLKQADAVEAERAGRSQGSDAPAHSDGRVMGALAKPNHRRARTESKTASPRLTADMSWRVRIKTVMEADPDREWSAPELLTACAIPGAPQTAARPLEVVRKTANRMVLKDHLQRTVMGRYRLTGKGGH
jgi:hypothetical protein